MKEIDLIWDLWSSYKINTPSAGKIQDLLKINKEEYFNDHIAFRTINNPHIGKERIAEIFIKYGWEIRGEYHFQQKKLDAIHLEHTKDINLPKIFISELILEQVSSFARELLSSTFENYDLCDRQKLNIGRKHPVNFTKYQALVKESEYASWLYIFGFQPNHFTIYINNYPELNIESFVNLLLKERISMNTFGGIIKGHEKFGLKQASSMADIKYIKFEDRKKEFAVPSCYVEFAERFNVNGELFSGFITSSADKIFESTKNKK